MLKCNRSPENKKAAIFIALMFALVMLLISWVLRGQEGASSVLSLLLLLYFGVSSLRVRTTGCKT